ncbi:MAG: hypothetical protein QOE36_833 [Gaiellaceae bacterium]|jgi:GAF domain-containing protein|nr:hypothetical protein [Gaiellaceae bacterium]
MSSAHQSFPQGLEGHQQAPSLLRAATRELTEAAAGSACVISRLIGEALVELAEYAGSGRYLQLGHGYLLSDFPLTRESIERREPRLVSLLDENPEPTEARILEELRFDSLLMIPLLSDGRTWGLVEIYRDRGCRFEPADVPPVERIVTRLGELLAEL